MKRKKESKQVFEASLGLMEVVVILRVGGSAEEERRRALGRVGTSNSATFTVTAKRFSCAPNTYH